MQEKIRKSRRTLVWTSEHSKDYSHTGRWARIGLGLSPLQTTGPRPQAAVPPPLKRGHAPCHAHRCLPRAGRLCGPIVTYLAAPHHLFSLTVLTSPNFYALFLTAPRQRLDSASAVQPIIIFEGVSLYIKIPFIFLRLIFIRGKKKPSREASSLFPLSYFNEKKPIF